MNICVFLSASDLDERYTRPAREFAELLGKGGHTLVWGGSDVGLMKVVADGVQEAGGRLLGVSVDFLSAVARPNADDMLVTTSLAERKALLLAKADAVVIMVGGTGTLDEATEILELKKHGKTYEFHRYDGAGHGFNYWHRPLYRPEQAMDAWGKVFAFFGKHLAR